MHTTSLSITGMSCGSCRNHVNAALRAVKGVTEVQVDLTAGTARIRHEDGILPAEFVRAVEEASYDTRISEPMP